MGDRTSIQFKNKDELSPILYGHWAGKWILSVSYNFLKRLKKEFPVLENGSTPISRREPSALLPMFISIYIEPPNPGELYSWRLLDSKIKMCGTDNGHWIIDVEKMTIYKGND